MKEQGPKLSIIVCTHNRPTLLQKCLKSLEDQSVPCEWYEIVVVDSCSTDHTPDILREIAPRTPNLRFYRAAQPGLSRARNLGLSQASSNRIAFIDDDALASRCWVERLINSFENIEPPPDVVGGDILPWYEDSPPRWFVDDFEKRTWGGEARFLTGTQAKYGFSGSNMAFRVELLKKYGGFSNDYGMVKNVLRLGEETQLFYRLNSLSLRLWYDPQISVKHFVPKSKMKLTYRIKRAFYSGYSFMRIKVEDHGTRGRSHALLSLLWLIARLPFRLIRPSGDFVRNCVKQMEFVSYKTGAFVALLQRR